MKRIAKNSSHLRPLSSGIYWFHEKPETEEEKKTASFYEATLTGIPLNKLTLLSGGKFAKETLNGVLKAVNQN